MSENDGHDHSLKIFQGAKIEIFGPAHMPTGRKGATSHERPKMTQLPITHNYMTFWPTLGPYK